MFSNLSASLNEAMVIHPITNNLSFSEYISRCRSLIEERRSDLKSANSEQIIEANSPFELYPNTPIRTDSKIKYGVLLIHGLLDCPFSLRDIGHHLQAKGILSKAILLPGHGTTPSDLIKTSYQDWIETVRYGVQSLRQEVDQMFIIGYSTGAALAVYQAVQDEQIAGLVLLSPAIKIKAPVNIVVAWHFLWKWIGRNNREWLYNEDEIDYAKYRSIVFNAVTQVAKLTAILQKLRQQHDLSIPMFMVISREDETISSHRAIDFFSSFNNKESKLLLYTSCDHRYPDKRIITRMTDYPDLHIKHFSHASIPFAPTNSHYGQNGNYIYASHTNLHDYIFGAYNRIEIRTYEVFNQLKLIKQKRRELTYNPDFNFMAEEIVKFIAGKD